MLYIHLCWVFISHRIICYLNFIFIMNLLLFVNVWIIIFLQPFFEESKMKILENILLSIAIVIFLFVVVVVAVIFGIFSLIAIFIFAICMVIFLMLPVWKALLLLILSSVLYYFLDKYKLIWRSYLEKFVLYTKPFIGYISVINIAKVECILLLLTA